MAIGTGINLIAAGASALADNARALAPSRTTITTIASFAATGFFLGGMPGLALGVGTGIAMSPISNGAVNVISAGIGTVVAGIKQLAHSTVQLCKSIIVSTVESLFGWLVHLSYTATLAKSIHADEMESYLQSLAQKGMDLRPLMTPTKGGVAEQTAIMDRLTSHATNNGQALTPKQITEWVALGERIVHALALNKNNTVKNGEQVFVQPNAGLPILVESSLYTVRAINWYITAQALFHATARAEVQPDAAKADDVLNANTFVLPDPGGKLFEFINHMPESYEDTGKVLNQQSALDENRSAHGRTHSTLQLRAVDDTSHTLPGRAGRVLFNRLKSLTPEDDKALRLAFQLQTHANPTWTGQRARGHENLSWQAMQVATGVANKMMSAVEGWAPIKVGLPSRHHALLDTVHKKLDKEMARIPNKDEKSQAHIKQMKQFPLLALLRLFGSKSIKAEQRPLRDLINKIPTPQYIKLREMIIETIQKDAQGSWEVEKSRENDELFVPTQRIATETLKKQIRQEQAVVREELNKIRQTMLTFAEQRVNAVNTVVSNGIAATSILSNGLVSVAQTAKNGLLSGKQMIGGGLTTGAQAAASAMGTLGGGIGTIWGGIKYYTGIANNNSVGDAQGDTISTSYNPFDELSAKQASTNSFDEPIAVQASTNPFDALIAEQASTNLVDTKIANKVISEDIKAPPVASTRETGPNNLGSTVGEFVGKSAGSILGPLAGNVGGSVGNIIGGLVYRAGSAVGGYLSGTEQASSDADNRVQGTGSEAVGQAEGEVDSTDEDSDTEYFSFEDDLDDETEYFDFDDDSGEEKNT